MHKMKRPPLVDPEDWEGKEEEGEEEKPSEDENGVHLVLCCTVHCEVVVVKCDMYCVLPVYH